MQTKNFLIILMMWQMAAAEENCPGVKLAAGLGSLLGDIPISSCAPELPLLPELACGREEYWGGLPCGPRLPSLPCGDFGCSPSLPCLPELPCSGDFYDYPCFGEPLPYLKKKKGCGCLAKSSCLKAKSCGCGLDECGFDECGLKECALKECCLKEKCLKEKEDCGFGLKVVPLIKKFPLKKKKLDCYDGFESLPCELPHLLSGVVRGSLYNDRCY